MNAVWAIAVAMLVIGVFAFILVGLVWLTPFGHRENEFRDSSGRPRGQSPHMETRDEYEHSHPA